MSTAASILSRLPRGKKFADIKELLARLQDYLPEDQINFVYEAYLFGAAAHEGQKRLSGEPYISHPVAVANILADLKLDYQSICAALLHDVIEDTSTDKTLIADRFGNDVAEIVDGVSKLDQLSFKSRAEAQAESFRKMLLAVAKDIRVILVKLADRLHNMRTLSVMRAEKRGRIARETLEIYAPIANRLGIHSMRVELEDLGFRHLHPRRYKVLDQNLKKTVGNQRQVVKKILKTVKAALEDAGIDARTSGREKHLFSIYQKMRRKGRSLAEIVDVYGFRVVVEDVDTCYRALGVVHRLFKPMPGRFKDYIAIPRMNGYQSLHTTLFGPNGIPIEAQIRTGDMDMMAETGVASHWFYKSGEKPGAAQARASEWLERMVEMQDTGSSEEFLESVRIDLFPEKVYVFTPVGDILRMPRGATAVDFAYAVHTDVGNRCIGAKIDRRAVPLHTLLRNGQTVEIVTSRSAKPNPAWGNFVVTAKARAAIRTYLKNLRKSEAVRLGKRLLSKSLSDLSLTLRKVDPDKLKKALGDLNLKTREELFTEIGLGRQLAPLIARRMLPDAGPDETVPDSAALAPLGISGTEGMLVTYARCCYPVPPDNIMGYLSAGRGLVVHRETCGNLVDYRKQPDKWIAVEWEEDIEREFPVEIRVDVVNRMGVLAAVSANIAGSKSNIETVQVVERDGDNSTITFLIKVNNGEHLTRVLRGIGAMSEVLRVQRVCA